MGLVITSESKITRSIETKRIGTLPNGKFIVAFVETCVSTTNYALYSVEPAKEVSRMLLNTKVGSVDCTSKHRGIPTGDEKSFKSYREGITLEEDLLEDGPDIEVPIVSHWVLGLKSMRNIRKNLGDDSDWGVVLNPYTLVTSNPQWSKDYEVFHYVSAEDYYTDLSGNRIDCCIRGTLEQGGLDSRVYDLKAVKKHFVTCNARVLDEVDIVQTIDKYGYTDKYRVLCWEYMAPVSVCDSIFKQSRESGLFSVQDIVIQRLGLSQFKHKRNSEE